MSRSIRKFIAILMLLWLPLFTGNALAASVAMQMAQGECDQAATPMMAAMDMPTMNMIGMDMTEHQHHYADEATPSSADKQDTSCNGCGVCHVACTAYLAAWGVVTIAPLTVARDATPYLTAYRSISSLPLLPPPLARV